MAVNPSIILQTLLGQGLLLRACLRCTAHLQLLQYISYHRLGALHTVTSYALVLCRQTTIARKFCLWLIVCRLKLQVDLPKKAQLKCEGLCDSRCSAGQQRTNR